MMALEVVHLKPKEDAVSIGPVVVVANDAVRMVRLKAVQLSDDLTVPKQLFVDRRLLCPSAALYALSSAAARFHIGDGQERLRTYRVTA